MFEKLFEAGKLKVPDADLSRDLWDITQEITQKHGLPAYEISNHARKGQESLHNLIYWRYGEYAGIGPGAHGRLLLPSGRRAQSTEKHPEMWLTSVETDGHGLVEDSALTQEEQGDEFLLMGLRLKEGIDLARYAAISNRQINPRQIDDLVGYGYVERTSAGGLRVTESGFPILDAVVADLAA